MILTHQYKKVLLDIILWNLSLASVLSFIPPLHYGNPVSFNYSDSLSFVGLFYGKVFCYIYFKNDFFKSNSGA